MGIWRVQTEDLLFGIEATSGPVEPHGMGNPSDREERKKEEHASWLMEGFDAVESVSGGNEQTKSGKRIREFLAAMEKMRVRL